MTSFKNPIFDKIDTAIVNWMHKNGHCFLRISLAVIFIWFGALKPFGLSPAQDLISKTVYWFPAEVIVPILGWWEVAIGIGLLFKPLIRAALFLLFLQMSGTMLPLILLRDVCFVKFPFVLTLEGQYIIKNLIIISAALVVGGDVRRRAEKIQKIHAKLLYDGNCRFCKASVKIIEVMDLWNTLEFVNFQKHKDLSQFHPELTKEKALHQLHLIEPHGKMYGGFFVMRRLCLLCPMLYPLLPVVYFPAMGIVGPFVYQWIAKKRYCLMKSCHI